MRPCLRAIRRQSLRRHVAVSKQDGRVTASNAVGGARWRRASKQRAPSEEVVRHARRRAAEASETIR